MYTSSTPSAPSSSVHHPLVVRTCANVRVKVGQMQRDVGAECLQMITEKSAVDVATKVQSKKPVHKRYSVAVEPPVLSEQRRVVNPIRKLGRRHSIESVVTPPRQGTPPTSGSNPTRPSGCSPETAAEHQKLHPMKAAAAHLTSAYVRSPLSRSYVKSSVGNRPPMSARNPNTDSAFRTVADGNTWYVGSPNTYDSRTSNIDRIGSEYLETKVTVNRLLPRRGSVRRRLPARQRRKKRRWPNISEKTRKSARVHKKPRLDRLRKRPITIRRRPTVSGKVLGMRHSSRTRRHRRRGVSIVRRRRSRMAVRQREPSAPAIKRSSAHRTRRRRRRRLPESIMIGHQ